MARLPRLRPTGVAPAASLIPPAGRWAIPVSRRGVAPVELHVSLAATLAVAVVACVAVGSLVAWSLLGAYVVSLALHEAAHLGAAARVRGARWTGATPKPAVLGPCGGIGVPGAIDDPREQVFVAMAGPLANLALVVVSLCVLAAYEGPQGPSAPLPSPLLFDPVASLSQAQPANPWQTLAIAMMVVNWPLFVVNLIPAAPFDGAVALGAWLRVGVGHRVAEELTLMLGLLVSAGLLGAGGALLVAGAGTPVASALLAALAVVTAFGAISEVWHPTSRPAWTLATGDDQHGVSLRERRVSGKEDDITETSLPAAGNSPFELVEVDRRTDEGRLDDLLAKVHVWGLASLTPAERRVLDEASRRLQRRRGRRG